MQSQQTHFAKSPKHGGLQHHQGSSSRHHQVPDQPPTMAEARHMDQQHQKLLYRNLQRRRRPYRRQQYQHHQLRQLQELPEQPQQGSSLDQLDEDLDAQKPVEDGGAGSVLWQHFSRAFRRALIETRLQARRREAAKAAAAAASTAASADQANSETGLNSQQPHQQASWQQLRARRHWQLLRDQLDRAVQHAKQHSNSSSSLPQVKLTGWELFTRTGPRARQELYARYNTLAGAGGPSAFMLDLPKIPNQLMAAAGLPALPTSRRTKPANNYHL